MRVEIGLEVTLDRLGQALFLACRIRDVVMGGEL
jgi:hypothetical protein